jgi:hypothetical protein
MILVAPNNSRIKGKIRNTKRNSKITVELEVINSDDVNGFPNFTRTHIGSVIPVIFDPESEAKLKVGDIIESFVEYLGDERGGSFLGKFS